MDSPRRTCSPGGGTQRTARSPMRWSNECTVTCSPEWGWWCCTPGTGRRSSRSSWARRARFGGGARTTVSSCGRSTRHIRSRKGVPHPIEIPRAGDVRRAVRHPRVRTRSSSSVRSRAVRCSGAGCTYRRGNGKIFYFSPGDQDYPVYHHKDVRRVIANGVRVGGVRPCGTRRSHAAAVRVASDFFNGHGYQGAMHNRSDDE